MCPWPQAQGQGKAGLFHLTARDREVGVEVELEPSSHKRAPQTLQIQPCSNLGEKVGSVTSHTLVPVLLALDVGGLADLILRSDINSC